MLVDIIIFTSKCLLEGYLFPKIAVALDDLSTDIRKLLLLALISYPLKLLHDLVVHNGLESLKVYVVLSHRRNRLCGLKYKKANESETLDVFNTLGVLKDRGAVIQKNPLLTIYRLSQSHSWP